MPASRRPSTGQKQRLTASLKSGLDRPPARPVRLTGRAASAARSGGSRRTLPARRRLAAGPRSTRALRPRRTARTTTHHEHKPSRGESRDSGTPRARRPCRLAALARRDHRGTASKPGHYGRWEGCVPVSHLLPPAVRCGARRASRPASASPGRTPRPGRDCEAARRARRCTVRACPPAGRSSRPSARTRCSRRRCPPRQFAGR